MTALRSPNRTRRVGTLPTLLLVAGLLIATPAVTGAAATNDDASQDRSGVSPSSESVERCDSQVREALKGQHEKIAKAQNALCAGTETITEHQFTLSPEEAQIAARTLDMSSEERSSFVARAATGAIHGITWTHAYNAIFVVEKHTGTTYWDGTNAWVSTNRGLTGKHQCHSEGGWQVGATVTNISCSTPGPSRKADAVSRFDIHAVFKGSPIVLNVGLHYAVTNKGATSSWQVGG